MLLGQGDDVAGDAATARTKRSISVPGVKTTNARASASVSLRTVCARPPGMWTTAPSIRAGIRLVAEVERELAVAGPR